MPARTARTRSKNDPHRRQRIIDATARIIGEQGIGAVTFRSVAATAGVPLGSTTYYFTDKDDLLVSTVRSLKAQSNQYFEDVLEKYVPEFGVAGGIARMMEHITTDWRASLFEGYGVYVSTFSQQVLRAEVEDWTMVELVGRYCTPSAARPIAFYMEGILAQVVLGNAQVAVEEVEHAVGRLLELGESVHASEHALASAAAQR